MAGKRLVDQKRLRAKKKRRLFFISLYLLFFVGLIVCGLSYVSSLSTFQIKGLTVVGVERESSAHIASIVRSSLMGRYIWLFPRASTLIYPKVQIEKELLMLPIVQSVDISRLGLSGLEIGIVERSETSQWCDVNDLCYSIDGEGFIFDKVASSTTFKYRGLIKDSPIGKNFLPEETFKNIGFFIRELKNMSLLPVEARLSSNDYVEVLLLSGGKLIIYTKDDLSIVLTTLQSIVADKQIASSTEEFLSNLDYLRLDAGNKVTYKKKN